MSTLPAKMSQIVTAKPEREIGCQELLRRKVTNSGFLRKKPEKTFLNDLLSAGRRWPQRFVVLLDGCMYIFTNEVAPKYQRASSLFGYDEVVPELMGSVGGATEWTFKVVNNLEDHERAFCFSATSEESMNDWMDCFRKEMVVANSALFGLIGTMPNGAANSGGSAISRLSDHEKRVIRKSVMMPRETDKLGSDDSESDGNEYVAVDVPVEKPAAVPREQRSLPPIPSENPDENQRKVSHNLASEAAAKNIGRSSSQPSKLMPHKVPVATQLEDTAMKKSSTCAGLRTVPVPPEVQSEYELEPDTVSVRRTESAPPVTKPNIVQRTSAAPLNASGLKPSAAGLKPSPAPKKPTPLVGTKPPSVDETSSVGGAWSAQKKLSTQWPPASQGRTEDTVESSVGKGSSEDADVVPKTMATKGQPSTPSNKPKIAAVPPTLKPKPGAASSAVPVPTVHSSNGNSSGTGGGVQRSTSAAGANANVPLKERVVPPVPPPLTEYELNSDVEELEQYETTSMTSSNISDQTSVITDEECLADPVAAAAFCKKDAEQCADIMKRINIEGAYMIRKSTNANTKTLLFRTLIPKDQTVKYTFVKLKEKQYALGTNDSPKFTSLGELLTFYRNNSLPNRSTTLSKPYSQVS